LQQGASELVGAGVDVNDHLAFGLWQGQHWWCEKRLTWSSRAARATSEGLGMSCETSAQVIALSGFARLTKSLTKCLLTLHIPKKLFIWVLVVGNGALFKASTFLL